MSTFTVNIIIARASTTMENPNITLKCDDGDVVAPRSVLTQSPVFAAMLSGRFNESTEATMPGKTTRAITDLVECLQGQCDLSGHNPEEAFGAYMISDEYMVDALKNLAEKRLSRLAAASATAMKVYELTDGLVEKPAMEAFSFMRSKLSGNYFNFGCISCGVAATTLRCLGRQGYCGKKIHTWMIDYTCMRCDTPVSTTMEKSIHECGGSVATAQTDRRYIRKLQRSKRYRYCKGNEVDMEAMTCTYVIF